MNELDLDAQALLRGARRGLSPDDETAARVRRAVDVALVAGAGTWTAARTGVDAGAPRLESSFAKLGLAAVVVAATGIGGYVLGYRAATAELGGASPPAARVVAHPAELPALEPSPTDLPADLPAVPLPQRATLPRTAHAPSTTAPPPSAVPNAESPLEIETRLLARVERALRDDNARLALGLLGELDRAVPGGQLAEERQAGRVMAHCALGSPTAPKLAADFTAKYPRSAYQSRIEQACAARPKSSRSETE